MALGDFAPAVDVGFAFDFFCAGEAAEEFAGVFAGGDFAESGAREGFDGVAAEEFGPVVLEEIAGGEDVAPGDFAAVGYDDADDVFAFCWAFSLPFSPDVARVKRFWTSSTKESTDAPTVLS